MTKRFLIPVLSSASLLLAGCGGMSMDSLWPFGGGTEELSRTPANATAYQCDGNKRLYVRYMDNGAYAWVILPEREFRLDKASSAAGTRYGSGKATLAVAGEVVTLSDGPTVNYTGCTVPVPAKVSQDQGDKKK